MLCRKTTGLITKNEMNRKNSITTVGRFYTFKTLVRRENVVSITKTISHLNRMIRRLHSLLCDLLDDYPSAYLMVAYFTGHLHKTTKR